MRGRVKAFAEGNNRFWVLSDDGVRVSVNGTRYVNRWNDHAPTWDTFTVPGLTKGEYYDIEIDYYEKGGGSTLYLYQNTGGLAQLESGMNKITEIENPTNSKYVLQQNGNQTKFQLELGGEIVGGKTYVMSGWYATSSTYNGEDTFFFARTVGTSNDVSTDKGLGKETELKPVVIGDLEWRHYYQPITIPSDYSSGDTFEWHVGSGTTHTNGYRYYAGLRLEEGGYPTIPFDSLTLTNIEGSEKIDNLGEIIDAGGWDLLEQLFYAGEPVSEASTAQVLVSVNERIPGTAMYLNTTKSEDLDGDGTARFDEAGTGLREITDLTQGVKSASSPTVDGQTREDRYENGLEALEKPSFYLKNISEKDGEIKQQLLQVGYQDEEIKMWTYTLDVTQTDSRREKKR